MHLIMVECHQHRGPPILCLYARDVKHNLRGPYTFHPVCIKNITILIVAHTARCRFLHSAVSGRQLASCTFVHSGRQLHVASCTFVHSGRQLASCTFLYGNSIEPQL